MDIALWDLLGKACGRPVCELLGAGHRELTAYAAPSLKPPEEAAADCTRAVERGFRAVKLRVGLDEDTDDRIVAAARDAAGPDVDLIVDANMSRDYRGAVDIARRYRDAYGVSWLEEPIRGRSLAGGVVCCYDGSQYTEIEGEGVCPNFRREVSHFSVPADVVQMENEQIHS